MSDSQGRSDRRLVDATTQTEPIPRPPSGAPSLLSARTQTEDDGTDELRPAPRLERLGPAYGIPQHPAPTDLIISGNEGSTPPADLIASALAAEADYQVRRYGRPAALEKQLALHHDVLPQRLIVCAGGDDALGRAILACCHERAPLVLPVPTFEMLSRYAALASADVIEIPWPSGDYPLEAVLEAARGDGKTRDDAGCVMVVTPNNPTGASTDAETIETLARELPRTLIVVDQAYSEYDEAGESVGRAALGFDNTLCVRTLSKAWGLAGLRVGYAIGAPLVIDWLRSVGQPYAVSTAAQRVAEAALRRGGTWVAPHVARVRQERAILSEELRELGLFPRPSQANFVLADMRSSEQAQWLYDAMASLGIAVRRFAPPAEDEVLSTGAADLSAAVRISCPGDEADCVRVCAALRAALAPEALLFDMDGVLADVSGSFRRAIIETAASYGVTLTDEEIATAKTQGDANDDWALTQRLCAAHGVEAELAEVTERFEKLYQGDGETPGLYQKEKLLLPREALAMLRRVARFAVVTGRPRRDAERFLDDHGIAQLFDAVICREDTATLKPDAAPVQAALDALGVRQAWLLGDTVDDIVAARAAGVVPIGVRAPGNVPTPDEALARAGAARVVETTTAIGALLDAAGVAGRKEGA
ncbi:MAG: aminotransferase class I/II-fold pyridoxal phosphate-dependent enzyme [Myxococcales bacterium]|nr:aminotransferase class I/II-fold pyridoxal phosphate-dependent enzyme [Myxococcales bacterium]